MGGRCADARAGMRAGTKAARATAPILAAMRSNTRHLIEALVLSALIFVLVRAVVQNFRVDGHSMDPSLFDRQYLAVGKATYWHASGPWTTLASYSPWAVADHDGVFPFGGPARGDIVILVHPRPPGPEERDLVKRIIAGPGDVVSVEGGVVRVNGRPIDEPYISDPARYAVPPMRVPPGAYFVLGDNRNNSTDSHIFGPVPREKLIGKAMLAYWPVAHLGPLPNATITAPPPPRP
jgi:signal peptidase I